MENGAVVKGGDKRTDTLPKEAPSVTWADHGTERRFPIPTISAIALLDLKISSQWCASTPVTGILCD